MPAAITTDLNALHAVASSTYSTPACRIEIVDMHSSDDSWEAPGSLQAAGDWCHAANDQCGTERYRLTVNGAWFWGV